MRSDYKHANILFAITRISVRRFQHQKLQTPGHLSGWEGVRPFFQKKAFHANFSQHILYCIVMSIFHIKMKALKC